MKFYSLWVTAVYKKMSIRIRKTVKFIGFIPVTSLSSIFLPTLSFKFINSAQLTSTGVSEPETLSSSIFVFLNTFTLIVPF